MAELQSRPDGFPRRQDFFFLLIIAALSLLLLGMSRYSLLGRRYGFVMPASRFRADGPPVLSPLPTVLSYRGLLLPWRVGIQIGHWKIEELPPELRRLSGSTGARYGRITEVEINQGIALRVAEHLQRAGIAVDLLPATVPPAYDADAFVAIHADGAARPGSRGWKAAAPWRASRASRRLRDALAYTYSSFAGLPEDRYGTTYNMRGYYAFSPHRFTHAVAFTTPSIIIETGFITVEEDREVLLGNPETVARGISLGIIRFLSSHDPLDRRALVPEAYPARRIAVERAELKFHPGEEEKNFGILPQGALVRPVHQENGWVEVVVWGNYRRFGWLRESDLDSPLTE